jgi:hypothetical protein
MELWWETILLFLLRPNFLGALVRGGDKLGTRSWVRIENGKQTGIPGRGME